jgi:site-specific recombinase XerD
MSIATLPTLLQSFFTERLLTQRQVSPHTVASYRDTFRLLLRFAQRERHKPPSQLNLGDLDADLISQFLATLAQQRRCSARTCNARLTAIRSFFTYASYQEPGLSAHIQRVLSIPYKRQARPMVAFLVREEIEAILKVPDRSTWLGRRDHALLVLAFQTGLRVSELISLERSAITLGAGPHVRCRGKGRKDRSTPLTKATAALLGAWLKEPGPATEVLFPNARGGHLSADSVQYLVRKYARAASARCPTLSGKRISPHVMRHYVWPRTISTVVAGCVEFLAEVRFGLCGTVLDYTT